MALKKEKDNASLYQFVGSSTQKKRGEERGLILSSLRRRSPQRSKRKREKTYIIILAGGRGLLSKKLEIVERKRREGKRSYLSFNLRRGGKEMGRESQYLPCRDIRGEKRREHRHELHSILSKGGKEGSGASASSLSQIKNKF